MASVAIPTVPCKWRWEIIRRHALAQPMLRFGWGGSIASNKNVDLLLCGPLVPQQTYVADSESVIYVCVQSLVGLVRHFNKSIAVL